ncbi:MAG TPA: hypothetical protein VJ505_11525 [Holophagaceae bacterium]|nr:hypothetical protein [Holophagaceae bacterium]
MSVLRRVSGVILGFVVASAVMMVVEFTNGHLFYPDLGQAAKAVKDAAQMKALMAQVPVGALLVVMTGWLLGAIAGGWAATRLARAESTAPAFILGGLLILAGITNNLMMPPPLWFWVASLAVFFPGTWYGARLAGSR